MIRILVVDDHPWVRETLSFLLGGTDDLLVVGECADADQILEAVTAPQPDVVLMDVHMPVVCGLEATRQTTPSRRVDSSSDHYRRLGA